MKKVLVILLFILCFCTHSGCSSHTQPAQVVATTLPVYTFCEELCEGTEITIAQLIQDSVSCLHDYTLQVSQMQVIESAQVVVINGAGLEDFLSDALVSSKKVIDSSNGIAVVCADDEHDHEHEHAHGHEHSHAEDAHFWLSPMHAKVMAENISAGLTNQFPEYKELFARNLERLHQRLDDLLLYGENTLQNLSTRDLVTFHDGFSYFAQSFDLHILQAIEEEAGSETSAAKLVELIEIVRDHSLPAVFAETNGSTASAGIIAAETGAALYNLNMGISQGDYFEIMYHNIDTIKEALE